MTTRNFYTFLLLLSHNLLLCCKGNKRTQFVSQTINSNEGVSLDTLNFIYDGPKEFTLEYFPRKVISSARNKGCKITEQDSTSKRVARNVQFDKSGDII